MIKLICGKRPKHIQTPYGFLISGEIPIHVKFYMLAQVLFDKDNTISLDLQYSSRYFTQIILGHFSVKTKES